MSFLKWFLGLRLIFFKPLIDKASGICRQISGVFCHSSNTRSTRWHGPSDYREHPINPEAAISKANLKLSRSQKMASHLSTRLWNECRVALLWLAKSGRAHGRPGPRKSTKGRCVTAASYRHMASSLLPRLLPLLHETHFFISSETLLPFWSPYENRKH